MNTARPWLWERARRTPDAPALLWHDRTLIYSELVARADAVAGRLAGLGVTRGDRVATVMDASPRFVETLHAVQGIGATVVPLNTRLTGTELAQLIDDAEPRLVLVDAGHAGRVGEAGAGGRAGVRVVETGAELDAAGSGRGDPVVATLDPGELHSIVYTSGTTGRAKGVMLTHGNHEASARASRERLGHGSDDRWLAVMPLYHVGGLAILLRAVLDGAAVLLQPGFDPREANLAIRRQGASMVSLVATMLGRMLEENAGRAYPNHLRCALLGGGPVQPSLVAEARSVGMPVAPTYGLTETASQLCTVSPGAELPAAGFVGKPLAGAAVAIDGADENGWGEIMVRGPSVMAGYFGRPQETSAVLSDGWLRTGDIGWQDTAGNLYVEARRTDLIVSGGENVSPAAVEAVLLAHPDVAEAAVFGVPDAEWGQRVMAVVVMREPTTAAAADFASDADELTAWCRRRLAAYKVPREILPTSQLPRTASGKLKRAELIARLYPD